MKQHIDKTTGLVNDGSSAHIGTVLGLARTLESFNLDSVAIFAQAGLDLKLIEQTHERISTDIVNSILKLTLDQHIIPCFGLRYANNVFPLSYEEFGAALLASANLREFCLRLARDYSFINSNEVVGFEEDEKGGVLYFQAEAKTTNSQQLNLQCSGTLATWLCMIRMMYNPDYHPEKVALQSADPGTFRDEYESFFGCPLSFLSDRSYIRFNNHDLDFQLPGSNPSLARFNDNMVMKYLAEQGQTSICTQIKICLLEQLPKGAYNIDEIAQLLNISVSDLAQALQLEHTSLTAIVLTIRQELVMEYIHRKDLSISAIAHLLGFSDCSNFSRSFKLWHGISPSEYREHAPSIKQQH
jgi:AraC-like DNA-binding protein|tara:strand:+ start:3327 stop:4394 length:1068 start_codon:yes stop_codon:yes gene_type:complete